MKACIPLLVLAGNSGSAEKARLLLMIGHFEQLRDCHEFVPLLL